MVDPTLELSGVSVQIGGTPILEGIDLAVHPGEWVTVIGRSGCGKTTLLRALAGLVPPSAGTIRRPPDLGMCFQEPRLLPWRTTLDNVSLPLERGTLGAAERRDRALAMLERVGLAERALHRPAELSGGMRMRAALARALVTNPRLLLLDEPCSALDELTRDMMDALMRGLFEELRPAVVLVTHSLSEAAYCSDRVLVMEAGRAGFAGGMPVSLGSRDWSTRRSDEFHSLVRALSAQIAGGGL